MKDIVQTRFNLSPEMMQNIVREINEGADAVRMVMMGTPSLSDFTADGCINPSKVVGYIKSAIVIDGKIEVDIDILNDMPLGQAFNELHDAKKVRLGLALAGIPKSDGSNELEPDATLLYLYYYSVETKK